MEKITLNNRVEMPILGFGTYQIDPKNTQAAVADALETGYRSIDTATLYQNEAAVGFAIKNSGVKRIDLFITTKLWIDDMGYESAKKAFELSLSRLQLDYVDLYLIHQPQGDINGSWKAMEELYMAGKIRAIGVSNFSNDQIKTLISQNEVIPVINQIETHPFDQRIRTQQFLKEQNVHLESWAPFAEGKNHIFENEVLRHIASRHDRTVAQVILRWLIQREIIAIPKSIHKDRIKENFRIFDFELSYEDMHKIKSLDMGKSLVD